MKNKKKRVGHPKSPGFPGSVPGKRKQKISNQFAKKRCFTQVNISPNRFTCGVLSYKKNRLDTLVGALGLVGRGFGPAGRAGLGWAWGLAVLGLAVLGALAGLGVLAVLARWLGWAWCWACWARCGRGVWACWRWLLGVLGVLGVVLGVGFGCAGRAGLGWAWGLAMVGALTGLGVVFKVEKWTIEVQSRLSKCNTLKYTLEVQK